MITSFHSPHNNFETLTLLSKLHRDKWQEMLSQERLFQILDPLLFSNVMMDTKIAELEKKFEGISKEIAKIKDDFNESINYVEDVWNMTLT